MSGRQIRIVLAGILKLAHIEARYDELVFYEIQLGKTPNTPQSADWHQGSAAGVDSLVRRLIHLLELSGPDDDTVLSELKAEMGKMPPLNFELGAVQPPKEDLHGIFSVMSAARSNSKKKGKLKNRARVGGR